MNSKIKVVITSGYRWNYFEWFLLGLYELDKEKKIKFQIKSSISGVLLSKTGSKPIIYISKVLRRIFERDSYNMDGYVEYSVNGIKVRKKFTIDSADSPYLFDEKRLRDNDIYFKMQCPKNLFEDGFYLTSSIKIPWCDHAHVNGELKFNEIGPRKIIKKLDITRVKPLMIGPRQLSECLTYKSLKNGYDKYLNDRNLDKSKGIMCYFGNALGPKPNECSDPDFDNEADLLGYFGKDVSHPNEKRARVAEILKEIPNSDARIISTSNADNGVVERKDLIVPLMDFCKHISQFNWNVNVSGYRLSIPNRFIESFIVGTGIISDQLFVKWYLPFEDEVFETVPMGYLPMNNVDWDRFRKDFETIPKINAKDVITAYESKWSPTVVAQYIIDTVTRRDDN